MSSKSIGVASVEIVHGVDAAVAALLDRTARLALLLRAALLGAAQPLGRCGRTEVGAAIASAGTGRARPAEPAAARTRAAEAASAGTRTAEAAAARAWSAEAAATAAAEATRTRAAEAAAAATKPPGRGGGRSSRARASLTARLRPWNGWASKLLDDFLGRRTLRELDEREAARTPGLAIDGHHHVRRFGYGGEVGAEVGFARPVRKVPDEQTDCQGSLVKCAVSVRRQEILSQIYH